MGASTSTGTATVTGASASRIAVTIAVALWNLASMSLSACITTSSTASGMSAPGATTRGGAIARSSGALLRSVTGSEVRISYISAPTE